MRNYRNAAFIVLGVIVAAGLLAVSLPPTPEAQALSLHPLGDNVVVLLHDSGPPSGLSQPANQPQSAEVLAVGPGRVSEYTGNRIPLDVSVGDVVYINPDDGTEIRYEGVTYIVVPESNVLLVVG